MKHHPLFLFVAGLSALGFPLGLHGQTGEPVEQRLGVMTHFAHGWDPALVSVVASAGLENVRDELYWQVVEPQRGTYSFPAAYDRTMAELARNDVSPLIVLSFENSAYDGGDTPWSDDAIAGYARYAVEVLRHYGPQIRAVEVWNEYNGSFARGPVTQNRAAGYLKMLRESYRAIKRERPDVTVVAGATAGVPLPYWQKLLDGGILESSDALSIHPYTYDSPPEDTEAELRRFRKLLADYPGGAEKPVWATEIGWFTKASAAEGDLAIDDQTQARFLTRALTLLLANDVQRAYWYLLRDNQGLTMGLVRDDATSTAKPAFDAMETLLEQLRGARFVRRESTASDVYSLVFARENGEEVRVVWSLHPRWLAAEGATSAVNVVGTPVDLSQPIGLDDSPLFVTGPLPAAPLAATAAERQTVIANAEDDFSGTQGAGGWFYGVIPPNAGFTPFPEFKGDDWHFMWTGGYPYASITLGDQHPSNYQGKGVATCRRWESDRAATVRITGRFHCGMQGDGVVARVAVDGAARYTKPLGGGRAIADSFDFFADVRPGSVVDFIVDPGPAANINNDATRVSATILAADAPSAR